MLARLPFGSVPLWQLLTSLALLFLTFITIVHFSAKIYRVGILMYGKKITWKELWKWMRYKNWMRKYILTAICLVGLGLTVLGAQTIKAQRVWMDTTEYSHKASESIVNIINTYSPQLHVKMNKVVGYTTQTMYSYAPESPLSNMAADALLAIAKRHYGTDKVDFALTNFGGIRTFFPKGDLTLYYVYAALPI